MDSEAATACRQMNGLASEYEERLAYALNDRAIVKIAKRPAPFSLYTPQLRYDRITGVFCADDDGAAERHGHRVSALLIDYEGMRQELVNDRFKDIRANQRASYRALARLARMHKIHESRRAGKNIIFYFVEHGEINYIRKEIFRTGYVETTYTDIAVDHSSRHAEEMLLQGCDRANIYVVLSPSPKIDADMIMHVTFGKLITELKRKTRQEHPPFGARN